VAEEYHINSLPLTCKPINASSHLKKRESAASKVRR
jgi:hypothetical protein